MKKIVTILVIFIISLVVVDRVFTGLFSHYIFAKTISGESGGTINYVINTSKPLDFLIMGGSRAKHSIDPKIMTSLGSYGHNVGVNGTNVLNSFLILDILVSHKVIPKVVVLQTDLSDYGPDSKVLILDQIKRLYPYNTAQIRGYVKGVGALENGMYSFGLYRYNRKIANIVFNFFKRNSVGEVNGYVGLQNTGHRVDPLPYVQEYPFVATSTNREALRKLIQLCDDNGIQLVIVFPPSYTNVFRDEFQQKRLIEDIVHEGSTTVIDMSDIKKTPELVGEENWRDAIHFNATGSVRFSTILNKKIGQQIRLIQKK